MCVGTLVRGISISILSQQQVSAMGMVWAAVPEEVMFCLKCNMINNVTENDKFLLCTHEYKFSNKTKNVHGPIIRLDNITTGPGLCHVKALRGNCHTTNF